MKVPGVSKQAVVRELVFFGPVAVVCGGVLVLFFWHLGRQPYPVGWDDGAYVMSLYRWMDSMHAEGVWKGFWAGFEHKLPGHMPPMLFVSSLPLAWVFGTVKAMHTTQVLWFMGTICFAALIGRRLSGRCAGWFAASLVAVNPIVFFFGTRMLGEPSFFALLLLSFWVMARALEKPNLLRVVCVGLSLGAGMLTKQWFPVMMAGPVAVWALFLLLRARSVSGADWFPAVLRSILCAVVAGLGVCGPWFWNHWEDVLEYLGAAHFAPHSLGDRVTPGLVLDYLALMPASIGWPLCVMIPAGTCAAFWWVSRKSAWRADNVVATMSLVLLLLSAVTGFVVVILIRYSNTRFVSSAMLIATVVVGAAIGRLVAERGRKSKSFRGWVTAITLQAVVCVSMLSIPLFAQSWDRRLVPTQYRPVSTEITNRLLLAMASTYDASETVTFWVAGYDASFNQPLLKVQFMEKGVWWRCWSLYSWQEEKLDEILARVKPGHRLLIYLDDHKRDANWELIRRWDQVLVDLCEGNPDEWTRELLVEDRGTVYRNVQVYRRAVPVDGSS